MPATLVGVLELIKADHENDLKRTRAAMSEELPSPIERE